MRVKSFFFFFWTYIVFDLFSSLTLSYLIEKQQQEHGVGNEITFINYEVAILSRSI